MREALMQRRQDLRCMDTMSASSTPIISAQITSTAMFISWPVLHLDKPSTAADTSSPVYFSRLTSLTSLSNPARASALCSEDRRRLTKAVLRFNDESSRPEAASCPSALTQYALELLTFCLGGAVRPCRYVGLSKFLTSSLLYSGDWLCSRCARSRDNSRITRSRVALIGHVIPCRSASCGMKGASTTIRCDFGGAFPSQAALSAAYAVA